MEKKNYQTKENLLQVVATVGEGYVQSQECEYYIGTSQKLTFCNKGNVVIIFSNPKNSEVNVVINSASFINYSKSPASVEVYSFASTEGNLTRSYQVGPGNLNCISKVKPNARIYGGTSVCVEDGLYLLNYILPAYNNVIISPSGSVILPPGTSRFYVFNSSILNEEITVSMNFNWWEESLNC